MRTQEALMVTGSECKVCFFFNFYFGILLDLQKNCKDNRESSHIYLTDFPIAALLYYFGTFVNTKK